MSSMERPEAASPNVKESPNRRLRRSVCIAMAALAAPLGPASAQGAADAWPNRAVKVIVSLAPGSAADTTARYVARQLERQFKQPFVVENRVGGNSFIGAQLVAKAPPDGYTLYWTSNSAMTTNLIAFKQLPYHPVDDFAPIALGAQFAMAIVVAADAAPRTLGELVAYLRKSDTKASFGASTATYHLGVEQFLIQADAKALPVPYNGTAAAVLAVAARQVDFALAEVSTVLPLIRSGKLRALAVTGNARLKDLPDVPTTSEAGMPGYEMTAWVGGFFPAKVDAAIVDKAAKAVLASLRSEEGMAFIQGIGGVSANGGPRELREFQEKEIVRMRTVAQRVQFEPQ